ATGHQSHSSILDAAETHVLDSLDDTRGITAVPGRLDSRLRLAQCDQALESFTPYHRKNSAKVTVGIRCNGSHRWTLYVPVSLTIEKAVLVASRELSRGTILTAADFKTEIRDVARLHRGYLTTEQQVIGKKLKRTVHSDNVLTPSQLTIQHAVKKGSQVIILANIGSLQVRMQGKALGNGAIGERIKVENSSSSRRIEVTVISPGIVQAAT
ncbi:MAG: flagellar basal body P-ring formation chaperone FlgA, partial [Sedimenticola sp.]|nr:flagellar basal body P-ring formation chaperone FlgA [Sedimenticola sp.]